MEYATVQNAAVPPPSKAGTVKITLHTANNELDEKAELTVQLPNADSAMEKMIKTLAQRFPPESVMTIAAGKGLNESSYSSSSKASSRYTSSEALKLSPEIVNGMSSLPNDLTSWILSHDPALLPDLLQFALSGGDPTAWARQKGLDPAGVRNVINQLKDNQAFFDWVARLVQLTQHKKKRSTNSGASEQHKHQSMLSTTENLGGSYVHKTPESTSYNAEHTQYPGRTQGESYANPPYPGGNYIGGQGPYPAYPGGPGYPTGGVGGAYPAGAAGGAYPAGGAGGAYPAGAAGGTYPAGGAYTPGGLGGGANISGGLAGGNTYPTGGAYPGGGASYPGGGVSYPGGGVAYPSGNAPGGTGTTYTGEGHYGGAFPPRHNTTSSSVATEVRGGSGDSHATKQRSGSVTGPMTAPVLPFDPKGFVIADTDDVHELANRLQPGFGEVSYILPDQSVVKFIETEIPEYKDVIKKSVQYKDVEIKRDVKHVEYYDTYEYEPEIVYETRELPEDVYEYVDVTKPKRERIEIQKEIEIKRPVEVEELVEEIVRIPDRQYVDKPYEVKEEMFVPRYMNKHLETVVAQKLKPVIRETQKESVSCRAKKYEPVLYAVDIFIPKPVTNTFIPNGVISETHRNVTCPPAQYNSLLKAMNKNLSDEGILDLLVRIEGGAVPVLPPGELAEVVPPHRPHRTRSRTRSTKREKKHSRRH